MCKLCAEMEENIMHVLVECAYTILLLMGEFLDENGRRVETVRRILEEREKMKSTKGDEEYFNTTKTKE